MNQSTSGSSIVTSGVRTQQVKKTDKSPGTRIQPQLTMSCGLSVFRAGVALVLMCSFYTSAEDSLPELSPQQYFSSLQPGKASLAYFCQDGPLSNSLFLEELKEAIRPLQDYGISVAKVTCVKEEASRYCGEEESLMKAYLFRGSILLREFPADILFDVNAIIAHVLFALLFNEVKYITTLEDLHSIENSLKGKSNMIFSYVEAIGTPGIASLFSLCCACDYIGVLQVIQSFSTVVPPVNGQHAGVVQVSPPGSPVAENVT